MAKLTVLKPRIPTLDTRIAPPPPKQVDPHYGTSAHKRWAAEVKRRAGAMCQDPQHQGDRLADRGIADHAHERRDGGADLDPRNGMWRCWSCHGRKTAAERAKRASASHR